MKNQKFISYGIIIIIAACPIIIFLLDYYNVGIKNITKDYDWLSFLGSYIGSIATIFLGYVTLIQNKTLAEINVKIAEENIRSEFYSEIKFNESQDIEKTNEGLIFRINITDKRDRPLDKLILKEIRLLKFYNENNPLNPYNYLCNILDETLKNKEIDLEYTPHGQGFYLARIKISERIAEVISDCNAKIEIDMSVINTFKVIENGTYSLIFDKIEDTPKFINLHLGHYFAPKREILYKR